jgi:alpha-amylase
MKKIILSFLFSFLFSLFSFLYAQDVYYEIFVRSFQDSSGDGVGDFKGVIQRLDYLQELGVTGIWFMPIHPSPSYHGYDITDYYAVNPDYGTMEDFKTLLAEADKRNIKIILDLVVNHTSDQHPWFQASKTNDATYRDYYSWSETDLGWKGTSGAPAWHQVDTSLYVGTPDGPTEHQIKTSYYLGLFWSGMPDLNFRNPAVVEEINNVAKFWLDLGVDGFRVDAIQHIVETNGNIRNTAETFAWLKTFEAFIKTVKPEAFLVGETWTDTLTVVRYHRDANLDMSFNYPLWNALLTAIQKRSVTDLEFLLEQDEKVYPDNALRGTFTSNHDQIRPASTLNIRRDVPRLKLAAGLLLTLPGVPFIYYGEEIGMPNGAAAKDEEKRTPMRWDDSANAGFSSAAPWYPFSTEEAEITVSAQEADPESLLNWYKTLIALRKDNPALSQGTTEVLETEENALLAFKRVADEQEILVLANVGNKELEFDVGASATDLITGESVGGSITVGKLGMKILELSQ